MYTVYWVGPTLVIYSAPVPSPPPPCGIIRKALNLRRERHSLPPLREDPRLHASAKKWVLTFPTTHGDWIDRIRAEGVTAPAIGEIIAWEFHDLKNVTPAWMHSPPHRAVILNPSLTRDGAGCAQSTDGRWSVVVDFAS